MFIHIRNGQTWSTHNREQNVPLRLWVIIGKHDTPSFAKCDCNWMLDRKECKLDQQNKEIRYVPIVDDDA
jgi:hypothetical protein